MTIEFTINSVTIQTEDIREQFPDIVSVIYPHLPAPKKPKRRQRRKRKTAGPLIQAIIDGIDCTEK